MQRNVKYKVKLKVPTEVISTVPGTKKRGHVSNEEPYSDKRCRVESESSDLDNPLGISFEGCNFKSTSWSCLTWPSLTELEPEILDTPLIKVKATTNTTRDKTDNRRH